MNQLFRIARAIAGIPGEIVFRAFGVRYRLGRTVCFRHQTEGWMIVAWGGTLYDGFTYAPNLRKADGSVSDAAAIHDEGWLTGRKFDGRILTFDENNFAFRAILDKEGHPEFVKDLYEWGVSLPRMRRLWREKHGHK